MTDTRTAVLYSSDERLPQTTGSDVQRVMSTLRARLVARYRLSAVPGRPEELTQASAPGRTISLGYGCKTVRIRKHGGPTGRDWADHLDIQIREGWHAEVYAFLDQFMGFDPRKSPAASSIVDRP